jgi:hypothetical protein
MIALEKQRPARDFSVVLGDFFIPQLGKNLSK